jgi:YebC/PmpR family DNA-binding regulatory protein
MSGHSKWANIKHRKAAVDAKRGKLFTKASKEIIVAARLGGSDPDANARLRMAIDNARAVSMPMDNIKRAIQRGTGEIEGATYEDILLEGYGPGGVAIMVECTTENRNRTVQEVRATFSKYGGNLGETNSVGWNFTRSGEIHVESNATEDELLEIGIEVGAADVIQIDDGAVVHCSPDHLGTVAKSLAQANVFTSGQRDIRIIGQRLVFEPNTTVEITNKDIASKLISMLDVFDENDDVQNVYNNAEIDDEAVEGAD